MKLKIKTDKTLPRRILGAVFWTLVWLVLGAYLAFSVLVFLMRGPSGPKPHSVNGVTSSLNGVG